MLKSQTLKAKANIISKTFTFKQNPNNIFRYFTQMAFFQKPLKKKKVRQMKYPCIPDWMKKNKKDEFDYPLRSKEEIYFEQFATVSFFPLQNEYRSYSDPNKLNMEAKYDMRNEIV